MKIVLADDHDMVRESLTQYARQAWPEADIHQAHDFETLMPLIQQHDPNLVICDYVMPGMNNLNGVRALLDQLNDVPLVMISGLASIDDVISALRMGASGFLFKTMSARSIVSALQLVHSGDTYLPRAVLDMIPEDGVKPDDARKASDPDAGVFEKLTDREAEILTLLTEGMTNKDIARHLKLREITVKVHLKNTYRKLGVANRTQASNMAFRLGFVEAR